MQDAHLIRNIFCIGRNYVQHAKELGNAVPTNPMIFSKPTHALHPAHGELVLSAELGEIHYEVELVIRIAEPYEPNKSLEHVIDGIALGIDLTARDIQSELKEKGHPWLLAKGFKGSAVIGEFIPFTNVETFNQMEFQLIKNGQLVQIGQPSQMIFSLEEIVAYISKNMGLAKGDIIFTGTPEGVGAIRNGDILEMKLGSRKENLHVTQGPLKINIIE